MNLLKKDRRLFIEDIIKESDIKLIDIKNLTNFSDHCLLEMMSSDIYESDKTSFFSKLTSHNANLLLNALKSENLVLSYCHSLSAIEEKSFFNTLQRVNSKVLELTGLAYVFEAYSEGYKVGEFLITVDEARNENHNV